MGRFKSPRQAQMFLSLHHQAAALFKAKRHKISAILYRHTRADAFSLWAEFASVGHLKRENAA